MAEIITLHVGPLEVNCYILFDRESKEAFIIDPGGDTAGIEKALKDNGLKLKYILNTHGHFDHVGANGELKLSTKAMVCLHGKDVPILKDAHEHGAFFGYDTERQAAPDALLEEGQTLEVQGIMLKVIHTPGHTPGSISFFDEKDRLLFAGDTLFAGSIGRTDFPGGSYEEIIRSIKGKLLPLGDDVKVFPGHGPTTTIGTEKAINPFVR